ncbi:MAG TPA: prolyl oligopeptidase family serine peptidase [Dongiaceae bacterium]|jgi:dipeptidyl aminopeptidase/acylaminoacyl peptidase|nr:prolyl oligopeptidase family serine peptidase [Dongiaceae bacterium]
MSHFESLEPFLDRLFRVSEAWGARLSPDGRRVAWIAGNLGATTQVWHAPTDGSASPTAWTSNDRDCDWLFWAPDSGSMILGQSRDGDERVGLSQVALDGTARELTEQRPDFYIHGGQIDPTGRFLVYAANRDPATGREIETHVIYRHEIASGERVALARLERAAYVTPRLSPDGRQVLYSRKDRDPAGRQLWLVGIDGSRDREVLNAGDARKADGLWAPDSAQIVVTAEAGDHRRVGLLDTAGDATRWLIDDPALQVAGAHWPKGSDRIVLTETRSARDLASLVDPADGQSRPFPGADGTVLPIGPAADGFWICYHYDARHPMRLVRQHGGALHSVSELADRGVASSELAAAEDFRWRSGDDLEIQGWLYRPKGKAQGAIILVHGGPTAHSEDAFDPEVQYLVAAGFAVLQPNYRGSTGFGLPFQDSIKQDGWGGREQDDIARGAAALIAQGISGAGRVGVTGTSYGGYSSWWQIVHTPPEIIKASAPICGMTDLVVDYETTRPDLRPYSEEMMGGSPAQVPQRYRERSPIHFVDRIRGRLLIIQGMNDPNVTPRNVTDVRGRLDAAGIRYEVLMFEDEGHGISKPENRKLLCRRLARFFAEAFER